MKKLARNLVAGDIVNFSPNKTFVVETVKLRKLPCIPGKSYTQVRVYGTEDGKKMLWLHHDEAGKLFEVRRQRAHKHKQKRKMLRGNKK